MTAPRVSVVVPVRDGEAYLAESLDAILGQSVPAAQVVVVDDGSTDGTPQVLDRFARHVQVVRQAPSGQAAAVNGGIAAADGTIVAFCDADDCWTPRHLEVLLGAFDVQPDLAMAVGLTEEFLSPDATDLATVVRVTTRPSRARLLQALIVRRAAVDLVGMLDTSLRHGANVDWISRADALGVRMGWVDEVVVRRRIHRGNLGHDTRTARAELLEVIRRDRRRRAGTPGAPSDVERAS